MRENELDVCEWGRVNIRVHENAIGWVSKSELEWVAKRKWSRMTMRVSLLPSWASRQKA